jgi:hypothetical protein
VRRFAYLLALCASLLCYVAPAAVLAQDPMEGRLASEVRRTQVWSNDTEYTPPVYDVSRVGKRGFLKVELRGWYPHPEVISTWGAVAIPNNFKASPGSDQEVVLRYHGPAHTGTYKYCEFWGFHWEDDAGNVSATDTGALTPVARAGGCDNYSTSRSAVQTKWWPYPLGVQASGARFLPGIVTAEDWFADYIGHEVDIVVPEACGTWRAPAVRTDGWGTPSENTWCLEYGTLYKLPKATDCDPLGWWGGPGNAKATRMVCEAARDFGLRITDRNLNNVGVRYENIQARTGADPFGLSWDDRMLRWYFPWDNLYVAH